MLLHIWVSNCNLFCDHLTGSFVSRSLFEGVLRLEEAAVADMNSGSPEPNIVCGSAGFGL